MLVKSVFLLHKLDMSKFDQFPDFNRMPRWQIGGSVLLSAVALTAFTGCDLNTGPNYSGKGNDFEVQGQVTKPGKHSLKARIFETIHLEGKARHWFKPEKVS